MKERRHIEIQGIVQGVGFRPFVYGLATRAGLAGQVLNNGAGVSIEVEGEPDALDLFTMALQNEAPPLAVINHVAIKKVNFEKTAPADPKFLIAPSDSAAGRHALISPDMTTCEACLDELFVSADHRYRYPFINCTHCGPRFTIVKRVPYDRPYTTMAPFTMCSRCQAEYDEPTNRRFHAQPNACPGCGPQLELLINGESVREDDLISLVQKLLAEGNVVAIKGLGGYHLACDAAHPAAVARLRAVKHRGDKPLAVMVADLATAKTISEISPAAAALLTSPPRPIVLLPRRSGDSVASAVAPGQHSLGVMLPYTPLHHLLLHNSPCPVLVMSSANRAAEPIIYEDEAVVTQLGLKIDAILRHNRSIYMRCDDSVGRVVVDRPQLLRRARGYAPQPLPLNFSASEPVLGVGAHLKNSVCLIQGRQAFVSHHLGDLETVAAVSGFADAVAHYQKLFDVSPAVIAHDLHPDYHTTHWAENVGPIERIAVQHHHAHIASVLAEHRLAGSIIGVAFDGSGYGPDGTIWGGEFLMADLASYERLLTLQLVALPGGEQSVREPWRVAAAWLDQIYGNNWPLSSAEMGWDQEMVERWPMLRQLIDRRLNAPQSSSMGRLFDSAAALLGVRQRVTYEGQAAIELETLASEADTGSGGSPYRFHVDGSTADPSPVLADMIKERKVGVSRAIIAAKFHDAVADLIVRGCAAIRNERGLNRVALSGGVFQNRLLLTRSLTLLNKNGFDVFINERVPPNDGGIALGQAAAAAARFNL